VTRVQVAYLVLSHRPPSQLRRLLSTLRAQDPLAPLVVHHDRFSSAISDADVDIGGQVELLTSDHPIRWGDFSLVDAYWRSLRWMNEHLEFDWVVLLSAQDYPIKPLSGLSGMLESANGDAIVSGRRIEEIPELDQRSDLRFRYYYQYLELPELGISGHLPASVRTAFRSGANFGADVVNRLQSGAHIYKFPPGMGFRVGRRSRTIPFGPDAPCWHASFWATLNRVSVDAVMRRLRDDPAYARYYRSTVVPDESVTATILCNDPDIRIVNAEIHHVRWSNAISGHPDTFGADDLAELAASPKFFARKFDIGHDAVILERLDDLIARP